MVDKNMQTSFDDDQNETKYFALPNPKGLAGNPWKEGVLIRLHKHLC
jgi:hypothetical protein